MMKREKGSATFLPTPGVVGSEAALQVLREDPYVQEATTLFDKVSLALIGIGAVEPSDLLAKSGNTFSEAELEILRAVGDIFQ